MRAPAPGPGSPSPWKQRKGAAARRSGRRAEWVAALLLMAKGYRILGMRLATPQGEIDLVGLRGAVLAIVEVKQRRSSEEALLAVTGAQQERLRRAGRALAARLERNIPLIVRLDLVALAPGRWPRHIPDAWPQG
ncbi:MAG: YraN family protein [Caulobacteraceae bacterium]|nr:YraN family protein [Caulobacteraceae bacterium]